MDEALAVQRLHFAFTATFHSLFALPASGDPSRGLTAHSAAASRYGLGVGLLWWPAGLLLAAVYAFFAYRRFPGKVKSGEEGY